MSVQNFFNKKIFLLGFILLLNSSFMALAETVENPLDEFIKQENQTADSQVIPVLKGSATRLINKEGKISVSITSLLSSDLSTVGDLVEARILVKGNGSNGEGLQALKGSRIIGEVIEVKPSRKAGRAGFVKVSFTKLKTKTGKEFPIKAELTTETFKGKEAAKLALYDAKLVTLGALWGTYNSLKWSPIAAFSTQGLSLAVSAGIGASLGIIGSVRRKGESKTFLPGTKSTIKFQNNFSLDEDTLAEVALANQPIKNDLIGLKMELLEANIADSEEFENILKVKIKLQNQTSASIYPCDLLLIPKDGSNPVMADLRRSGTELLHGFPQGEQGIITLMYPVEAKASPKDYTLALIDPLDKAYLSELPLSVSLKK